MIRLGIIEDDAEIRQTLTDYFNQQPGFSCALQAGSVEAFLQQWPNDVYLDMVLSDIGLPGQSGIKGVPLIKRRPPMPGDDAHRIR